MTQDGSGVRLPNTVNDTESAPILSITESGFTNRMGIFSFLAAAANRRDDHPVGLLVITIKPGLSLDTTNIVRVYCHMLQ